MKAIISVVGRDSVGIIACVSTECAKVGANIIDISQTVMGEYFTMMMFVNIDNLTIEFNSFVDIMTEIGKSKELEIHTMHEDIFNSMHRIWYEV